MDKVRELKLATPKHQATALEYLNDYIKHVEAGEVIEISVVAVKRDGNVSTCFTGGHRFSMLGGLQYLTHRINESMEFEPE